MKGSENNSAIVACQMFQYPKSSEILLKIMSADAIYVRGDYLSNHADLNDLSLHHGIKILSLKSVDFGGKFEGDVHLRHRILIEKANFYDIIELESDKDLTDEVLRAIPANQRMISWHGKVDSYSELEDIYRHLKSKNSRYYKITIEPATISDCIFPLKLIKSNTDKNLITYATGAIGVWTQVLSIFLGNPMVFGNLDTTRESTNHLSYDRLNEDYNIHTSREITNVFGIAGNPVFTSMSPLIHNACYSILGMTALYLPFHISQFEDFWQFISSDIMENELNINMDGFTMVSPYKEDTYRVADEHLCPSTLISKACNILVRKNGKWKSDSSDGLGVVNALEKEHIEIIGKKIAIIGCGGAGRTIAARLKHKNANITFFNRSQERGDFASKMLSIPYYPLSDFIPSDFDIVINATPVGKYGRSLIFDPSKLKEGSITIDMSYAKDETLLVQGCRQHGNRIIEGKQILLYQVKKQFNRLTGKNMPLEVEYMVREKTANFIDLE